MNETTTLSFYDCDQFTRGYIVAALWSSVDDDGEPLDSDKDASDLAPMTLQRMIDDCAKFQSENADDLNQYRNEINTNGVDSESSYAGHDFWLTRNGHGAGFWDGDVSKELGKRLTQASKGFGECNLYVGDDGMIYL